MADTDSIQLSCPFCFTETITHRVPPGQKVTCKKCNRKFSGYRMDAASKYPLIGLLAIQYGTVSLKKMDAILVKLKEEQKKGRNIRLENMLIKMNLASQNQMDLLFMIRDYIEIRAISEEFGRTAISLKMADPSDIEKGLIKQENEFKNNKKCLLIGDILIEEGIISLEQCEKIVSESNLGSLDDKDPPPEKKKENKGKEIEKPILDITPFEEKFLAIRAFDKEFCRRVLQKGVVKKDDVRSAYNKQTLLFKKRKMIKHIGEILVIEGVLSEDQCLMIVEKMGVFDKNDELVTISPFLSKINTQSKKSKKRPEKQKQGDIKKATFEITLSNDYLSAYLMFDEKGTVGVKVTDVKKELKKKGVVYGIFKDLTIAECIKNKSPGKVKIASGKAPEKGEPPIIDYYFDTDYRKPTQKTKKADVAIRVARGKVLAEMTPGKPAKNGVDVFGNSVSHLPLPNIKLKCGAGARFSNDGLKVLAKNDGIPKLSIDGKIFVFSNVNIHDNADFRAGPLGDNSNINIAGTLTGAYPVKGGELKADEIRGADVNLIGDVFINVGINKTTLFTQGCVFAKYIMNSNVFAFGDVIVQNEIIDSVILTSGKCVVKNSRIIASEVTAKLGIVSAGIGSPVTEPCKLEVGSDGHIKRTFTIIDNAIEKEKNEIRNREKEIKKIEQEIEKTEKKIIETKNRMDKNSTIRKQLLSKVETFKKQNKKKELSRAEILVKENARELKTIKVALQKILNSVKGLSRKKKKIEMEIEDIRPGIEARISDYNDEKELIEKWALNEKGASEIFVKGKISSGTIVSGMNSTLTLKSDYRKVQLKERKNAKPDNPDWAFKKLVPQKASKKK